MRGNFDFAPFRRSAVGFDRLFDMLESSAASGGQENYPPFDLIKSGDNLYRIEMAVAGFRREEIELTSHQNVLVIRGQKADEEGRDYVHRGIALRSFERRFAMADHIQVTGADLSDGMLTIDLKREIPEALKPRRIEIGGSARSTEEPRTQLEARAEQRTLEDA